MNRRAAIIIGFIFFITSGCGQVRIDKISEHSGLKLSGDYEVFKDTTKSSGLAGQDFEINVILEFSKGAFSQILDQVDSLLLTNPKWHKNDSIVNYSNILNDIESETIMIDLKKNRLEYYFVHI